MVKPYLTVSLKDPQSYYMEDETIHCQASFKSDKVLKEALIRVKFMGRSTSLSNSIKQHARTLFSIEKDVSIDKYNTTANVKKMNTVDFSLQVPSHRHGIPSFKNLEGNAEGGKIEYLVEATLEASGFLKKSVLATHIISIPLIGNVHINEHGLERTRESTLRWPKNEDDKNTCVLYAWIPHEGILRGKDVPIRVEFKQPDRYGPVENITISLVQQELISSAKDSPPDMTKQLPDRSIKKQDHVAELVIDPYTRLLKTSKVIVFSVPSDITPSIIEGGKVVRLDYKIRVTVDIPNSEKELSIDLPVVIGTVGSVSDSGFESPQEGGVLAFQSDHSHTSSSVTSDALYPRQPLFPGGFAQDIYPPLPNVPPSSMPISPGFLNPFNSSHSPYPPPPPAALPLLPAAPQQQQFLLNTQAMPFVEHIDIQDVTRMPMPIFAPSPFMPSPGIPILNHDVGEEEEVSPSSEIDSAIDQIDSTLSRMSTLASTKSKLPEGPTLLQMPFTPPVVLDKPNTPTPPLTPFTRIETTETTAYYSGLSMDDLSADTTRIDPPIVNK